MEFKEKSDEQEAVCVLTAQSEHALHGMNLAR